MRYVIIGNGVAGTTAASSIRDRDSSGDIMVVTDERIPFYSRIRLVEYLAGEADEAALIIRKEQWYRDKGITLACSRTATEIEPKKGRVASSDGRETEYDRLLVATGSVPSPPPIQGLHKTGVFTLRTIDDARRITDYFHDREHALVMGGGVLGIEVGNALRKKRKRVTIVEQLPRLLPRQLDSEGAALLQSTLERMGLTFFLGARTQEIVGRERVEGIVLQDGRLIKGDMLLVCAGVTPRASLLEACGISVVKGVPVSDRMETEIPRVYAAGDLIEHRGVRYGFWAAAERQGAIAGENMAGGNAEYEGTMPSHTLKVAGVSLLSAGDIDTAGKLDSLVFKDPVNGIYRKVVFRDGRLAGCILCGDATGRNELIKALGEKRRRDALTDALVRLGLDRSAGV